MRSFVDNIELRYPTLIRGDAAVDAWQGFGDWLATDAATTGDPRSGSTPKDLIGTAFFCYSAKLLARIAGVLGNVSDLEHYEALAQRIRAAFRRRFVTGEGRLVSETQTAYVLVLYFGLLDRGETDQAVAALVRDIDARGVHLSTGFVGTPYLLHVLTNYGRLDLALPVAPDNFSAWVVVSDHPGRNDDLGTLGRLDRSARISGSCDEQFQSLRLRRRR